MKRETFATVINCMDGRVQLSVNKFITGNLVVDYIDTITLAGPCKVLAEQTKKNLIDNIKFRLDISLNKHLSETVFIAGHIDCAAVEVSNENQKKLILEAVDVVKSWGIDADVFGLWVDEKWTVQKI